MRGIIFAALIGALAGTGPLAAQQAPVLGAASNFGQRWQPGIWRAARQLPVHDFRDAVYWRDIEQSDGRDDFTGPERGFPDLLAARGAGMSLTVNNPHPGYDDGNTPLSAPAVAAFADFAARAVARFPAIHSVEVGNEMNSARFVRGPGWGSDLRARAVSYTALLAATAKAVRAARPEVRILGGAAHSIPLYWFAALFEAGAARYMDALVIHPYGIAPEQLRAQIAELRTLPEAADMPIEVTEFGSPSADQAPAYLLKSYCQMALAGVTRAIWYPLSPRGDGMEALLDGDGRVSDTGRTYRYIDAALAGRAVRDAGNDPFTYGCYFGDDRLVIWGAPRDLTLTDAGVRARDAQGDPLSGRRFRLSRERPLILTAPGGDVRKGYQLAPQRVIADSVDQFAYPGGTGTDPFERLMRANGRDYPLQTRPGQEKNGVPWVPYLASSRDGVLRAGADWVLPSRPASGPLDVVYRYRVRRSQAVDLRVSLTPSDRSEDGVVLSVLKNGAALDQRTVTGTETLQWDALALQRGDVLEFVIGPGGTARGDVTRLRVTLLCSSR